MSEKSKSKAARRFGMKQMIQNVIINIILFCLVVGGGQFVFFLYTGLRWIPKSGGQEIAETMEKWADDSEFKVSPDRSTEQIEELVVRAIRKRASINFPENGKIKWELQSLGNFKGGNENMIERFDLKFHYPLKVNVLGLMEIQNKFTGKAHIVARTDSSISGFAKSVPKK